MSDTGRGTEMVVEVMRVIVAALTLVGTVVAQWHRVQSAKRARAKDNASARRKRIAKVRERKSLQAPEGEPRPRRAAPAPFKPGKATRTHPRPIAREKA